MTFLMDDMRRWIPQLQKFMSGGGCIPKPPAPPPKDDCPAAGWTPCGPYDCDNPGCCAVTFGMVNMSGCEDPSNRQVCAQHQCLHSHTNVNHWVTWDHHNRHPYTCCHSPPTLVARHREKQSNQSKRPSSPVNKDSRLFD